MSFNTSTRKLQKIWERVQKNINDIKNKDNIDEFEFFTNLLKQQHLKTPLEIFNSGDLTLIPNTDFIGTGVFTAIKGEKMPTEVEFSQTIDLQLPEALLPFVKYSVQINSLPDTEAHGFVLYDRSNFIDDSIEVRGDGTLVFKTDRLPTTNSIIGGIAENVFPDSFFTSNNISFDLSKEVWKGTITKNDDSVTTLNVLGISTTVITGTGTGNCVGSNDTEVFTVDHFGNGSHKIISLTATEFTAVGDLVTTTFTDTGSSCDINQVTTLNVTKTFTFSTVDSYTITLSDGINIPSSIIQSQLFVRNNNWLFWSTLKQKLFQLTAFGSDGDFKEVIITNFPNTNDGDTLPYTNITFKRNLVDIPDEIERESVTSGVKRVLDTTREFKSYANLSPSNTEAPIFRFTLEGSFIILSPATIVNPDTTDFPVYDDIYTVVSTTYSRTTTDHTILSLDTFLPETQDVTINIKAHLVNPLYWREQRRYNKNDV